MQILGMPCQRMGKDFSSSLLQQFSATVQEWGLLQLDYERMGVARYKNLLQHLKDPLAFLLSLSRMSSGCSKYSFFFKDLQHRILSSDLTM